MIGKILSATAGTLAMASSPPAATDPSSCQERFGVFASAQGGEPQFQKLGDLPPAALFLTVFRKTDGCITPVVVRTGIGATTGRYSQGDK
jgi:hypothetical protein